MPKVKEFFRGLLHAPVWLGILVAVVLILRIPSFFEPYYYGDEMIYLTLGHGIRAGIPLYLGLHDNKPPLIYLLAAIAGNLFWLKAVLAFFNVVSVIFFWKLATALFPKKDKLQQISTILFGLFTTLPLFEGNTVNAELLMVAPTLAAFWLLFSFRRIQDILLAGILFGLASLFKIPAAFEFPVIFVFWLFTRGFSLKKASVLIIGFLLPIGLSFLWYFLKGAGGEYLTAAFLQNFGYVSSWREGGFGQGNFLANNMPLFIRALVVGISVLSLFVFRKKLSKPFIFLSIWLVFALFAVTLSERPYPHYLIQAIPAVSFFFGMLVTKKTLEQSLTVIPLAIFFFVPFYFNFWTYSTGAYYGRFLNYVSGKTTKEEYFNGFDSQLNSNYKLAEFLAASSKKDDRVFVWGGASPAVYALSRRLPPVKYVADYHVFDYSSPSATTLELTLKSPKFIVFLQGARPYPELHSIAQKDYLLIDNANAGEIWVKRN